MKSDMLDNVEQTPLPYRFYVYVPKLEKKLGMDHKN